MILPTWLVLLLVPLLLLSLMVTQASADTVSPSLSATKDNSSADLRSITIDTIPRVGDLIVDGNLYMSTELPLKFEWNVGTKHNIGIAEEEVKDGAFKRFFFDKWTDLDNSRQKSITVGDNATLKAIYKEQYYLKIISEHGATDDAGWYDNGQTVQFDVSSTTVPDENMLGHRYAFAGWDSGDYPNSVTNSMTMENGTVVRANWKDQYQLELTSSIEGIEGIAINPGAWYDKGQKAVLAVDKEIGSDDPGVKYVFDRWTSIGEHPASISAEEESGYAALIMDNPYKIEAQWKKSYFVNALSDYGTTTGSGYYPEGTFANISTPSKEIVTEPNKVRVTFDGWDIIDPESIQSSAVKDGNSAVPDNQNRPVGLTLANTQVEVDKPITIVAKWKPQYYLDVSSPYGTTSGSGWYSAGTLAPIGLDAQSKQTGLWLKATFDRWSGDYNANTPSGSIMMSGPKVVRAEWRDDYSSVLINIAILVVAVVAAIMVRKRLKRNTISHDRLSGDISSMPVRQGRDMVDDNGNGSRQQTKLGSIWSRAKLLYDIGFQRRDNR